MSENHTPAENDPLAVLRGDIDTLDTLIVGLVARRTALTLAIGAEKQRRGIPTMVPGRHDQVVANYVSGIPEEGAMTPEDATGLSLTVQAISRAAQDRMRRGELPESALSAERGAGNLAAQASAQLSGAGRPVPPSVSPVQ